VDDQRLVEAIIAGDRDAFRELFDRDGTTVFRTCYRILGSIPDAEDAVQDTFVTVYRVIGQFRGEGSLTAWIARIGAREALRRVGNRKRVGHVETLTDQAEVHGGGTDPARELVAAEAQRAIRDAVAALDEPYREVVALRFFAELSLADIAAATERPLGTVKAQLHRGLKRLHSTMGAEARA
jgi:RNA polymerase sigma-70 factor (ECF subfamily)